MRVNGADRVMVMLVEGWRITHRVKSRSYYLGYVVGWDLEWRGLEWAEWIAQG